MSRGAGRPRPGNLPVAATSFVGRREELASARDLLAAYRLTTLTGPGGVGKTRLALEIGSAVAPAFPDGTWLIELADLRDPAHVAEATVAALGIGSAGAAGAVAQLQAYVEQRAMLLVLDNCEHVLSGCQALADQLLRRAPDLRILATSRQPLGLAGEHVVDVPPLAVPDARSALTSDATRRYPALALLEDRAKALSPGFALGSANLDSAARLCARLDGVPLAIELAAARLRALSVEQLLDRLDDRFAALTGGDPTAGPRHRTLRALVQWSHDLCSPAERAMWARASVFAGGFDLDAAEAVCADPDPTGGLGRDRVLDLVDGLVAKSILIPEAGLERVRYRLLETIAEHGREQLQASAAEADLRARHAAYYAEFAHRAAVEFWSSRQSACLQRVRREHANLTVAYEQLAAGNSAADAAGALRLASDLRFDWVNGGVLREGRRWLDRSLDRAGSLDVDPADRAEALWSCAWVAVLQGDHDGAERRLLECDALTSAHDLPQAAAHASTWHGTLALFRGDLDSALSRFSTAAELHLAAKDVEGALMTLFQLGITRSLLGDSDGARAACDDALRLSESVGETFAGSYAYWVLAHDAWSAGRLDEAEQHARHCLRLKFAMTDTIGIPLVVEVLGGVATSRGNHELGARLFGVAAGIWEAGGSRINAFGPQLAAIHHTCAARAEQALGAAAFAKAVAAGRAIPADQARALLLGEEKTESAGTIGGADVLSSREREVAELVGRGMSNRDIAQALVLSPRTVEGHVQRILGKLGARSRVEIGAWVRDHRPPSAS